MQVIKTINNKTVNNKPTAIITITPNGTVKNYGERTSPDTTAICIHLEFLATTNAGKTIQGALGASEVNPTINIWRWDNSVKAIRKQKNIIATIMKMIKYDSY